MKKLQVCTTVPMDLYAQAKNKNISFSQSMDIGLRKLLAMGDGEDPTLVFNQNINELNARLRKMEDVMQRHIQARIDLQNVVDAMKEKYENR